MGCGASMSDDRSDPITDDPEALRQYDELRRDRLSSCESAEEPSAIAQKVGMVIKSWSARWGDADPTDDGANTERAFVLSRQLADRVRRWVDSVEYCGRPVPASAAAGGGNDSRSVDSISYRFEDDSHSLGTSAHPSFVATTAVGERSPKTALNSHATTQVQKRRLTSASLGAAADPAAQSMDSIEATVPA